MSVRIGIRHETKNRWERRAPLVPDDVARLSAAGLSVVVQTSPTRVFDDDAYRTANAVIADRLDACQVILGVKDIPLEELRRQRTYVFFSHTIKGQSYNMPLLQRLLDLEATLIDYERIVDADGRRLVLFGREAGQAGMIDGLHHLGQRLAWEGFRTPLEQIRAAWQYDSLEQAKEGIAEVGAAVRRGIDLQDPPLVVGFIGGGSVSQGAQEILDLLPSDEVAAQELADTVAGGRRIRDRLIKVVFDKQHSLKSKGSDSTAGTEQSFDCADYTAQPQRYVSGLGPYLPHLTLLVNAIYWTDAQPKLVTREMVGEQWRAGHRRLRLVADLSCDIEGGIEFTHKVTETDNPIFVYDPISGLPSDGLHGRGIVVLAVDNLPCELPREASQQFSQALTRFVPQIAAADYGRPFAELDLPPEILGATVTHRGQLTPDFRYLESYLAAHPTRD